MNNRDWKITEEEATKFFAMKDAAAARRFVEEAHKLARKEGVTIHSRKMKDGHIRIKVPVSRPGNYGEAEVRLLNLLNKLGE